MTSLLVEVIEGPKIVVEVIEGDTVVAEVLPQSDPLVVEVIVPGPPGPPGAAGGSAPYTAVATVSGHRALIYAGAGVRHADPADLTHAHRIVGVGTNASLAGGDVTVVGFGDVFDPSLSFVPGLPVFVGPNGTLTQTPPVPPGALFSVRLGVALTATSLHVSVSPPFILN